MYEALAGTTKRLEKTTILAGFLRHLAEKGKMEWVYLLRGRVTPDYDSREFGISGQLAIKAISGSFGISQEKIAGMLRKTGDLGEIAEQLAGKKRQSRLFSEKLKVEKVFSNMNKLLNIEGKGAVNSKMELISELLASASDLEAKYIIRTLLSDLRVGAADAVLRDAIAEAFFKDDEEAKSLIEEKHEIANDFALILKAAADGKKELRKVEIIPGRPISVMLPIKVTDLEEAFRICGRPAALEHKYDGFRMLINKNGKEISLFTRKLENVTSQFPDVVQAVRDNVKADNFILDSEVVGYNPKTKKSEPFEAISQRIKRKYDIQALQKELPVEINVFDVVYCNGEILVNMPFMERRKILEKIIKQKELVIRTSFQIVTDKNEVAEEFYQKALKSGEEGVMIKKLDAGYKPGRRVGYIVKLKPEVADLDLVIVGAEYGSGKRGGLLTSYIVACRKGGEFLEVGKVSSGLKEKTTEGTTYEEMTALLKPLIISGHEQSVKVKPKLVVAVTYQNVQKSPSYTSGYAMRFPRITAFRPDRRVDDIATLKDIEKAAKKER